MRETAICAPSSEAARSIFLALNDAGHADLAEDPVRWISATV